jgi:hypothetical protein
MSLFSEIQIGPVPTKANQRKESAIAQAGQRLAGDIHTNAYFPHKFGI